MKSSKSSDPLKKIQPDFNAIAEREAFFKKRKELATLYQAPMIADFRANGFEQIESAGDLIKLKVVDKKLAALILKWLRNLHNEFNTQEMLVRGLILSKTPFDGKILTDLFDSHQSNSALKWAIGNTIACAKVLNVEDWLDRKSVAFNLGKESEMLIYAFARSFSYEKASRIIRNLFEFFPLQAADALARIGKHEELTFLKGKVNKYDGPQRTSINKEIKKLEKRLSK
jgi:hypothetical protein